MGDIQHTLEPVRYGTSLGITLEEAVGIQFDLESKNFHVADFDEVNLQYGLGPEMGHGDGCCLLCPEQQESNNLISKHVSKHNVVGPPLPFSTSPSLNPPFLPTFIH